MNGNENSSENIELGCPICGKILILPPVKPIGVSLRPIRTTATCDTCGGKFSYWGRMETSRRSSGIGKRRYCIYTKIPDLMEQRTVWQHRVDTEANWVKAPGSQTAEK